MEPVKYIRGVLGFASHYEFRDLELNGESDYRFSLDFNLINKDSQENELRFASPLYFLPVSNKQVIIIVSNYMLRRMKNRDVGHVLQLKTFEDKQLLKYQCKINKYIAIKFWSEADKLVLQQVKKAIENISDIMLRTYREFNLFAFFNWLTSQEEKNKHKGRKALMDKYNLSKMPIIKGGK